MEKKKGVFVAKLTAIIAIIFTMLFSSFAPIISWAEEVLDASGNVTESDYVTFNTSWGLTEIDYGEWSTGFTLQCNSLEQFKSFKIIATSSNKASVYFSNSGEYFDTSDVENQGKKATQYFKTIPGGTVISGSLKMSFPKDSNYRDYNENIQITLYGIYEHDGQEYNVKMERNINVIVHTPAKVSNPYFTTWLERKRTSFTYKFNDGANYEVSGITDEYELTIGRKNVTSSQAKLDLYRVGVQNNQKYYPDYITVNGWSGAAEKVENEDGSYSYIIDTGSFTNEIQEGYHNEITYKIGVNYTVTDAQEEGSTNLSTDITTTANVYTKVINNEGTTVTDTVRTSHDSSEHNVALYCNPTGDRTWGNSYIDTTNSERYYNGTKIAEFLESGTMDVSYTTSFRYVSGVDNDADASITMYNPKIKYFVLTNSGTSTSQTVTVYGNTSAMHVKNITVNSISSDDENAKIEFYKDRNASTPFFTATKDNLTYTAPEGTYINSYYAVANDIKIYRYSGWQTTYEMTTSGLNELGITNEQIQRMTAITAEQTIDGANMETKSNSATYTISQSAKSIISNFSIDSSSTELSGNASEIGIEKNGKFVFNLGQSGMQGDAYKYYNIENTNPVFYINIPPQYDMRITSVTVDQNYLGVQSYGFYRNGTVLKVKLRGKTKVGQSAKVTVNYKYSMTEDIRHGVYPQEFLYWSGGQNYYKTHTEKPQSSMTVQMTTDEGVYYRQTKDTGDINENGSTTDNVAYSNWLINITFNSQIQLQNAIYNAAEETHKGDPVYVKNGNTAKYMVILENNNYYLKGVNLINRLPFTGNKSIIEATQRELGSNTTLTNLRNITVYAKSNKGDIVTIDSSKYTIGYSQDAEAGFDSEYSTDENDAQTAKTFQIKFINENEVVLQSDESLYVEFEMDVPDNVEDGKEAFQISAVRTNYATLESPGVKLIVGGSEGKVEVVKSFEGANNPESVENIGIKLTNLYDTSITYEGQTDANGHVIFENIPVGRYEIAETTEFENYTANTGYVKITNGEQYTGNKAIQIVNKPKMAKLTIKKEWLNMEMPNDNITFNVSGTSIISSSINESVPLRIEQENSSMKIQQGVVYVPYGDYTITETTRKAGWIADVQTVQVRGDMEITATNKPNTGKLIINKTVPDGESVRGLQFKVAGQGSCVYTNLDGNLVVYDYDETFTIEDGHDNIQISEDNKSATITLDNMPVGRYTVQEINMPTISTPNGEITKYKDVSENIVIEDVYDSETTLNVENKYKTGNVKIQVTADEGVELNLFKVKVSGTSYYGTAFEQVYDVPDDGIINIEDLEIGTYKVEELNTKEVNGKIMCTSPDGFEVTYNPEKVNTEGTTVNSNETTNVVINNVYSGIGYVKIIKTLEGENDVSKAQGIQFRVKGKDFMQQDVDKIITIGADGTGTSDEIPVGTYALSEVEGTLDEKYELMEETEITITTDNTEENPLEIDVENMLIKGNIVMETELATGGYPSTPVTYTVVEVDDDLNTIGEPIDVTGNARSHAELNDVKAGRYLVSQKTIPNGYTKDSPQVVTVSRNEYGYALFIISKPTVEEFEDTKVVINKTIVNKEGNTATEEDFTNAKLKADGSYSFEVRIQNVDTRQVYYAFVDNGGSKTIKGLPYGTYEVEEVYKPKFKMIELTGTRVAKNVDTGKYTFTLSADENNVNNNAVINIKNQIDKDFPFGGQDPKDNMSKVSVETVEAAFVRQSKIYVRDDEDNKISDATFKLYDKNGNIIKLSGSDGVYLQSESGEEEISPVNGTIVIKLLPAGKYTLKCTSVSDSYLKSADKTVTVYDSAIGVTRIELLRNIPRGTIRLSTTYTDENNVTHYTRGSKYKIINPSGYETLKFIKKLDGTYERSNLPNATDTITLKAGTVDVTGVEVLPEGSYYEVGLVDGPNTMGIVNENAEQVVVTQNETQNVNVNVKDRTLKFKKVVTSEYSSILALDEDGILWYYSTSMSDTYEMTEINNSSVFPNGVLFDDIVGIGRDNFYMGIDKQGRVWEWKLKSINNITNYKSYFATEGSPKIKKIGIQDLNGANTKYALDENGKIWYWGTYSNQNSDDKWLPSSATEPVNLSELCDLNNVIITDISEVTGSTDYMVAVDNNGKVWTWGYNSSYYQCGLPTTGSYVKPTCISNIEGSNIADVKIKKVSSAYLSNILLDEDGGVWTFGYSSYGALGNGSESNRWNPVCLNKNNPSNPLNGIKIKDISSLYYNVSAVDENGKLWVWGYEYQNGSMGLGKSLGSATGSGTAYLPVCVNDYMATPNTQFKYVSGINGKFGGAIDNNGELWLWGSYLPVGYCLSSILGPTKISITRNSYLDIPKFRKISTGPNVTLAIDEQGRLWSWGYGWYMGTGYKNRSINTKTPMLVGGYGSDISKAKIVDIASGCQACYAIDEEGNLWAWGTYSSYKLGMATDIYSSDVYYPICLTKINAGGLHPLYNVKMKKIVTNYTGYVAAIDNDGKIWVWGTANKFWTVPPTRLGAADDEKKFVDVVAVECGIVALDENGKLWNHGSNAYYALGPSASTDQTVLTPLENESSNNLVGIKIKKISGKTDHCIALDENGKVYTWGYNNAGVLGYSASAPTGIAKCLSDIPGNTLKGKKIIDIEAGSLASLAVDNEGNIYTWGGNYNNELGKVSQTNYGDIDCVSSEIDIKEIQASFGTNFLLVLDKSGDIWACGYPENQSGQTEKATTLKKLRGKTIRTNQTYGVAIDKLSDYKGIIVSGNIKMLPEENQDQITKDEVLAKELVDKYPIGTSGSEVVYFVLTTDGELWSWGVNNSCGVVGDGTTEESVVPIKLNDYMDGVKIKSPGLLNYEKYEVFIDENNYMWYWGDGVHFTPTKIDKKIKEGSTISKVDTKLYFVGEDNYLYSYTLETETPTLQKMADVVIDKKISDTLYTDSDNNLWMVGNEFTKVDGLKFEKLLLTSPYMVQDVNGDIWTWGYNYNGQCGVGNTSDVETPTCISQTAGFKIDKLIKPESTVSTSTIMLLDTESRLWMWGYNNYGKCGNGTTSNVTTPYCVSDAAGFTVSKVLAYGNVNTFMVKDTNGKLWMWGQNNYGQCGNGTTSNVTRPVCISQTGGFITEKAITTGNTNVIQDINGDLWAWGYNTYGQCGVGSTTNITTPTKVTLSSTVKVSKVFIKGNTFIVKGTDGKLWSWGSGSYGKTGTGNSSKVTSPTCISDSSDLGTTDIVEVIGRDYIIQAKDSEGNMWTWGDNAYKICGNGSTDNYSKPKMMIFPDGVKPYFEKITCITTSSYEKVDNTWKTLVRFSEIATDADGKTWVWGSNKNGILGIGREDDVITTPVCRDDYYESIGLNIDQVILQNQNWGSNYVIDTSGDLWTWGVNTNGLCGVGNTEPVYTPTNISASKGFKVKKFIVTPSENATYNQNALVVDTEGNLWTWGKNTDGACANGTTENVLEPTCICVDGTNFVNLTLENEDKYYISYYKYILKPNGEAWAWGNGLNGNIPLKINALEGIGNSKIIEIAHDSSTSPFSIVILLENGKIYRISKGENEGEVVINQLNMDEILDTTIGPWPYEFSVAMDSRYAK